MRAELPVLSFICATLLALVAPLHWKSRNVAILSVVAWLLLCNLIQGINSAVWMKDTVIRAPVWCDVVTRLRLGAQVALPAASACICWHLHFLASNRDAKLRQHRTLIESLLCILLPLTYILLNIIVQDHRFALTENFGCVSSTYISAPAIILVWVPPFVLCLSSFICAGLASWSHFQLSGLRSRRSRFSPKIVTLTFIRPLITSMLISAFVLSAVTYSLYAHVVSARGILAWPSLGGVHAHFGEVVIITPSSLSDLTLIRIEVEWWVIPSSSLVFILFSAIGFLCSSQDDSMSGLRSVGKWISSKVFWHTDGIQSFITEPSKSLPTHLVLNSDPSPTTIRLDKAHLEKTMFKPSPISCNLPPSPSASDTESDASFILQTLNYIESPTGREALGLPPALYSPAKEHTSVSSVPSSAVTASPDVYGSRLSLPPPIFTSQLSGSPTDSILSGPWPVPPATIPSSPTSSRTSSPTKSQILQVPPVTIVTAPSPVQPTHEFDFNFQMHRARPSSASSIADTVASSTISNHAYVYDPALQLGSDSRHHRAPFEDSWIPARTVSLKPGSDRKIRKIRSKDSFGTRSINLSVKPHRQGDRLSSRERDDGIYMTVVQETETV